MFHQHRRSLAWLGLGVALACGGRAGRRAELDTPSVSPGMDDEDELREPPAAPPDNALPPGEIPDGPEQPAPSNACTNFTRDGSETDVDCGGPDCFPCDSGGSCQRDEDCGNGRCDGQLCWDLTCFDGVKNGNEALVDCDGECKPCPVQFTECGCATSPNLTPLACGGRAGWRAHTTPDGAALVFSSCTGYGPLNQEDLGRCDIVRWSLTSGTEVLLSDAEPRGLSADGQVVLIQARVPALLRADTGLLTELPLQTTLALSDDGFVVLGEVQSSQNSATPDAVLWTTGGGTQPLDWGPLPANATLARGVTLSGDASTIVGFLSDDRGLPLDTFRWTPAEGVVPIGAAYFSWDSSPKGGLFANADGSAIVGTMDFDPSPTVGHAVAFRWTEAQGAAVLEWRGSEPNPLGALQGVSTDGQRVLGSLFDGGVPFLWEENRGVWTLDTTLRAAGVSLDGWTLVDALALSGDGRVVIGRGYCGELQAIFRAVLPD